MDSLVKKSLAAPVKQLTCCMAGAKDNDNWVSRNARNLKGGKGKSAPSRTAQAAPDPALIRSYQADLERERKLREARNAQKNAERAAMRAHFRRKYQLAKNSKDTSQLKAVGGKVALPRELSAMVRPESSSKDEAYSIFGAFQGINLNLGMLTGGAQKQTPANGEQCRVM
ncbi:complexin-3 [Anguilla rostrata]|uniref:complexin-3 n=1 Tax=Anguilla rostrata TaxID=7938 RepID=UPI0030D18FD2